MEKRKNKKYNEEENNKTEVKLSKCNIYHDAVESVCPNT